MKCKAIPLNIFFVNTSKCIIINLFSFFLAAGYFKTKKDSWNIVVALKGNTKSILSNFFEVFSLSARWNSKINFSNRQSYFVNQKKGISVKDIRQ